MTSQPRATSASDIEYHYGTGNEFYALWLDETMTYSAALWQPDSGSGNGEPELRAAQIAKFRHHLDLAGAPEAVADGGMFRLLDVGCGWGGLLREALVSGRVTAAKGLTLSAAQYEYVTRHEVPGLTAALESWEEHKTDRPYDGIVSVGAFEHFVTAGTPQAERVAAYRRYFGRCHTLLAEGGSMSLQTIAYDGVTGPDGPMGAFVTNDMFPGSTLPRLAEITAACDPYFSVQTLTTGAEDYARTLVSWYARLTAHSRRAEELVGAETVHRYRVYLRACEVTFRRGAATLYRIGMRRRDVPLPLERRS